MKKNTPKISIIIPAKTGDKAWQGLSIFLSQWLGVFEILIVTAEKPNTLPEGVQWVKGRGGRAENLNDGAKVASAPYFWFVHADSSFEKKAVDVLIGKMDKKPKGLFYFDLKFAQDGPALMPLNSWGANFRSRFLGVPFGDQAFCIDRQSFEKAGQYNETLKNGEDHLFVWQCRHSKVPVLPINEVITTSARRYDDEGWLYVVLKFQYRWIKDALPQYLKLIKYRMFQYTS